MKSACFPNKRLLSEKASLTVCELAALFWWAVGTEVPQPQPRGPVTRSDSLLTAHEPTVRARHAALGTPVRRARPPDFWGVSRGAVGASLRGPKLWALAPSIGLNQQG